jgi:hypothetical protein
MNKDQAALDFLMSLPLPSSTPARTAPVNVPVISTNLISQATETQQHLADAAVRSSTQLQKDGQTVLKPSITPRAPNLDDRFSPRVPLPTSNIIQPIPPKCIKANAQNLLPGKRMHLQPWKGSPPILFFSIIPYSIQHSGQTGHSTEHAAATSNSALEKQVIILFPWNINLSNPFNLLKKQNKTTHFHIIHLSIQK